MIESKPIVKGDIVHLKNEGSKHKACELYLIVYIDYEKQQADIQKFTSTQLRQRWFKVKLSEVYVAPPYITHRGHKDDDEEEEGSDSIPLFKHSDDKGTVEYAHDNQTNNSFRRSNRIRNQPNWLSTSEIERINYGGE